MSRWFLSLFVVVAVVGCGRNQGSAPEPEVIVEPNKPEKLEIPKYKEFKNVSEATEALKQAARAVVKLETYDGGFGTAFFISKDGLLVTNNHVLGSDEISCALEGCYVDLYFNLQIGSKKEDSQEVFAVPVSMDAAGDIALFQIYTDSSKAEKFSSPHSLSILARDSKQLQGESVHTIGHPKGGLKKWTQGKVFRKEGEWFNATNFSLPGSSGSPFLNSEGKVLGILHRSSRGNGLISRNNLISKTFGTASAEIVKMQNKPMGLDTFFSVREKHDLEEITENYDSYLMSHQGNALLEDGTKIHLLDALAQRCDNALKRKNFSNTEQIETALSYCTTRAWHWINCRNPEQGKGYKVCPAAKQKEAWQSRFEKAAEIAFKNHSDQFIRWYISPLRLASSPAEASKIESGRIAQYIKDHNPSLSFSLALYLVMHRELVEYKKWDVKKYVLNYREQAHYEFSYGDIISCHEELFYAKEIDRTQFKNRIETIFKDEKLNLDNKMELELLAYELGLL